MSAHTRACVRGHLNPGAEVADDIRNGWKCGESKHFFESLVLGHSSSKPFESPLDGIEATVNALLTFCHHAETANDNKLAFD